MLEISYPIVGRTIPADHGYPLYSATRRTVPTIHNIPISIHNISGQFIGNRMIRLNDKSRLVFRIMESNIVDILKLSGKPLDIYGHKFIVGTPSVSGLIPSKDLYSRLTVFNGATTPEVFLQWASESLKGMGIDSPPTIALRKSPVPVGGGKGSSTPLLRRSLSIKGISVYGYAVWVKDLTNEQSIRLQERGLGGRRAFGCGIFIPRKS